MGVALSLDVAPRFPDCCVKCRRPAPDSTLRLAERNAGLLETLFTFGFAGDKFTFEIPACSSCRRRETLRRFARTVVLVVVALATIAILDQLFGWMGLFRGKPAPIRLFVGGFPAFVGGGIAFLVFEWVAPSPVEIDVEGARVEFEFADVGYLQDFVELNGLRSSADGR